MGSFGGGGDYPLVLQCAEGGGFGDELLQGVAVEERDELEDGDVVGGGDMFEVEGGIKDVAGEAGEVEGRGG